jgi:hypothetical protein
VVVWTLLSVLMVLVVVGSALTALADPGRGAHRQRHGHGHGAGWFQRRRR